MSRRAAGPAISCVLVFSFFGMGQEAGVDGSALQPAAREPAPEAWEFYLGTWLHEDEFGATRAFTFFTQGIYGALVTWDKSDLLLGTMPVAESSEVIFFDSDGDEDCHGIVSWTDPIEAYGIFYNRQQTDADGNDEILLTVYRYVTQGGVESSRDNFRVVMLLTRQPEEP